jgi:hypothetical protein
MTSRKPASSSSDRENHPGRLRAVLAIGEAIVAELGLEASNDVLGRWMAHHVAELMEAAVTAAPADRRAAEERCSALILEVWRHRNCLPEGRRPFQRLEPMLDTLAALDPTSPRPFYRREVWDSLDVRDEDTGETRSWLTLARQCDAAARVVMENLLLRAADSATSAEREWVRRAVAIETPGVDVEVLRRIVLLSDDLKGRPSSKRRRTEPARPLRRRLEALDEFENIARIVRADLQERIDAIAGDEPIAEP